MPHKNWRKRKSSHKFKRTQIVQTKKLLNNLEKNTPINKRFKKLPFIWRVITWLTGGFLAMIGFFPTIADSALHQVTPFWLFIFIFIASCVWLCNILWFITKLISKWRPINTTMRILIIAMSTLMVVYFVSPKYIDFFIGNRGTIEMPEFVNDSDLILVYYGNRPNPVIRTQTTIGELKQSPQTALSISVGNNSQTIFYVHIEGHKLYVDTLLFAGVENPDRHIFTAPVVIKNNAFSRKPDGWKIYQNNMNLEIQNQDGLPVLLMEYKSPYKIIVSGLFVTPMGICKVDNSIGDAIFQLGDTLSELGTYRVDRVFPHSLFDLFKSERTYILHD